MRDGGQHAEMHNTPVIYRLQQRDTNVVVVTAASVGEASLQRLLGTNSAVRAAEGDSRWRGFTSTATCSSRTSRALRRARPRLASGAGVATATAAPSAIA